MFFNIFLINFFRVISAAFTRMSFVTDESSQTVSELKVYSILLSLCSFLLGQYSESTTTTIPIIPPTLLRMMCSILQRTEERDQEVSGARLAFLGSTLLVYGRFLEISFIFPDQRVQCFQVYLSHSWKKMFRNIYTSNCLEMGCARCINWGSFTWGIAELGSRWPMDIFSPIPTNLSLWGHTYKFCGWNLSIYCVLVTKYFEHLKWKIFSAHSFDWILYAQFLGTKSEWCHYCSKYFSQSCGNEIDTERWETMVQVGVFFLLGLSKFRFLNSYCLEKNLSSFSHACTSVSPFMLEFLIYFLQVSLYDRTQRIRLLSQILKNLS